MLYETHLGLLHNLIIRYKFGALSVINNKNHDIEVLRTIAIVFVILAHIPGILPPDSFYWKIFNISRFGSGVDLFFCISGFIVTKSIISKNFHLMDKTSFFNEALFFYKKRMWRLLPASFFWILASLILSIVMAKSHGFLPFSKLGISALYSATQTQNFFFMTCRDNGSCGNLGIYWSLSLENQFYIILPILLFIFNYKKLCIFMFAVFLVQFFIPRTLDNHTPIGWPIRTDAMALGVIIAVLSTKDFLSKFDFSFLSKPVLSITLLIILCIGLAVFTKPTPIVSYQVGLVAIISGVLVFIANFNKNYFACNRLIIKLCDSIGSRSYSIYLTHVVAISITRGLFMNGNPDYSILGTITRVSFFFSLTLIFTEFSYRCIESKYRYYWKKEIKQTS